MKVKPWADTEETLAALHATLVARNGCDIFWDSLRLLLETLARDLKARHVAVTGTLVDNEVLDDKRYAMLIDEIRSALTRQPVETPSSTFRRLANSLSKPALMLLLLLGGAASIGCAKQPLNLDRDAGALADTHHLQPQTDGMPPSRTADTNKPQLDSNWGGHALILPDTAVAKQYDANPRPDAMPRGSDGATVTIQDIMNSCGIPIERQSGILDCLSRMHESWNIHLPEVLAGQDCAKVADQLRCFESMTCNKASGTEFDPASTPICQPIYIYLGVRFV